MPESEASKYGKEFEIEAAKQLTDLWKDDAICPQFGNDIDHRVLAHLKYGEIHNEDAIKKLCKEVTSNNHSKEADNKTDNKISPHMGTDGVRFTEEDNGEIHPMPVEIKTNNKDDFGGQKNVQLDRIIRGLSMLPYIVVLPTDKGDVGPATKRRVNIVETIRCTPPKKTDSPEPPPVHVSYSVAPLHSTLYEAFQSECVENCKRLLLGGSNPNITMPTNTGKTYVMGRTSELLKLHFTLQFIITPWSELSNEIYQKIKVNAPDAQLVNQYQSANGSIFCNLEHIVREPSAPKIIVATHDTYRKVISPILRKNTFGKKVVIYIDESHLFTYDDNFYEIYERNDTSVQFVLVSATQPCIGMRPSIDNAPECSRYTYADSVRDKINPPVNIHMFADIKQCIYYSILYGKRRIAIFNSMHVKGTESANKTAALINQICADFDNSGVLVFTEGNCSSCKDAKRMFKTPPLPNDKHRIIIMNNVQIGRCGIDIDTVDCVIVNHHLKHSKTIYAEDQLRQLIARANRSVTNGSHADVFINDRNSETVARYMARYDPNGLYTCVQAHSEPSNYSFSSYIRTVPSFRDEFRRNVKREMVTMIQNEDYCTQQMFEAQLDALVAHGTKPLNCTRISINVMEVSIDSTVIKMKEFVRSAVKMKANKVYEISEKSHKKIEKCEWLRRYIYDTESSERFEFYKNLTPEEEVKYQRGLGKLSDKPFDLEDVMSEVEKHHICKAKDGFSKKRRLLHEMLNGTGKIYFKKKSHDGIRVEIPGLADMKQNTNIYGIFEAIKRENDTTHKGNNGHGKYNAAFGHFIMFQHVKMGFKPEYYQNQRCYVDKKRKIETRDPSVVQTSSFNDNTIDGVDSVTMHILPPKRKRREDYEVNKKQCCS